MTEDHEKAAARPRVDRALVGILLLAAVVRLLFWAQIHDSPLYQQPSGDAATYVQLAQDLHDHGFLAPLGVPYERPPLYPLFLLLWNTLGLGLGGAHLFQFLLGVAGAGLFWVLGKRLGGRTAAVAAGLGGALYGPFLFFESETLSISLAVFFLEAALVLWGRSRWAVAVGLLLGAAGLAQPNFLLAGALAAGAALLVPRALGWPRRRPVALLLAGLAVFPLATLSRNLAVSGEPIVVSANGGINFFIGNNPASDGTFHLPPDSGLLNRPEGLFTSAREVAEKDTGRKLNHRQVDGYWWNRGFHFWLVQPGHALGLLLGKALRCFNNLEIPSHYDYGFYRDLSSVLRVLPTMGWLLPLGAVGFGLSIRRRRYTGVVFYLAMLASIIPFFVTARYRLPLAVFLLPAAGLAVQAAWEARRRVRELGTLAGTAAAYGVLAFFPLTSGGAARAYMLNTEGAALIQKGDLEGGRRAFEKALALSPDNAEAMNNLAYTYLLQGDQAQALSYYRRAIALDPIQAETYLNLEDLYRRAGRNREAIEVLDHLVAARGGTIEDVAATVAYRRGVNTLALGDTTAAVGFLQQAVQSDSTLAGAWLNLSILKRRLGHPEKSVAAAVKAAALAPEAQETQSNLGAAYEAAGKNAEAAGAFLKALEIGPPNPELHYRAGRVLLRLGRGDEAEREFLAANRDHPHPAALWDLARYYEAVGRKRDAVTAYRALIKIGAPTAERARDRLRALGVAGKGKQ